MRLLQEESFQVDKIYISFFHIRKTYAIIPQILKMLSRLMEHLHFDLVIDVSRNRTAISTLNSIK